MRSPAELGYRLLLRVFPLKFREQHGDAMTEEVLRQHRALAGLPVKRLVYWARISGDALRHGLGVRRDHRYRAVGSSGFAPHHSAALRIAGVMGSAKSHLLYSLRRLAQASGYAILFCATLGLGLGVLGTALGVVRAATSTQPSIRAARDLAFLKAIKDGKVLAQSSLDAHWMQRTEAVPNQLLDKKSSYIFTMTSLELGSRSFPVKAEVISGAYFEVLGVQPMIGRLLAPRTNLAGEFVASERFWQTRLGADTSALGKAYRVGGGTLVLVGVVPRTFNGLHGGHMLGNDIWLDRAGASAINAGELSAHVFGLVAEGRTLADVDQTTRATHGFAVLPFETAFDQSPAGLVATGVVIVLLAGVVVIACYSNVVGMFLTRLREREHELRIRSMLGASGNQLLTLLLSEVVLLLALSLAIGYSVARLLTTTLGNIEWSVGGGLNLRVVPAVDWSVVVMVTSGAVICAIGLSFAASRALRSGAAFESISRRRVVGVQCAVAVFLMALTTPLLLELRNVHQRYSDEQISALTTGWIDHRLLGTSPSDVNNATDQLVDRLRSYPSISGVSVGSDIPVGRRGRQVRVTRADGTSCSVTMFSVTEGFLDALGYQVIMGRLDRALVINELVMQRCGSGQTAAGDAVSIAIGDQSAKTDIAGIVRSPSWLADGELRVFVPFADDQHARAVVLVKARPGGLSDDWNERSPLYDVRPLKAEILERTGSLVASAWLGSLLSFAALTTSSIGLFGVVSLQTARRRREFATRLALGARADHIYRLVLGEYARTFVLSCLIGGVAALLVGQYLASTVVGVKSGNTSVTLLVPLLVVAGVGVVAIAAVWRTLRNVSYETLRDA